ncbi:MAG: TauD/TfdA family dioxygenase [Rhodospirillales bacterium]|nr:TauD/TfdA family dioxygenase [Rhodospirillales bacterium]
MAAVTNPNKDCPFATITPDRADEGMVDVDKDLVEKVFKKHGAILFRGFDLDVGIFTGLTQKYCTHAAINDSPGRDVIDRENCIQTVNLDDVAFPLHPELSMVPWKPDVCWFGCLTPPESGGETVLCDGVKIVSKMSTKVLKAYKAKRLRYAQPAKTSELKFWLKTEEPTDEQLKKMPPDCPFIFYKNYGVMIRAYETPCLHKPMFTDKLAFGNFLLFSRYLHRDKEFPIFEDGSEVPDRLVEAVKKISDKITVPIEWQAKDVAMVDNTRFLHGRNFVKDLDQRFIMTYFGYLKFADPPKGEENAPWRKKGGLLAL